MKLFCKHDWKLDKHVIIESKLKRLKDLNGVEFTVDSASFTAGTYTKGDYTGISVSGKIVASGSAVEATAKFLHVEDYKALSPSGALLTLKMANLF